MRLLIVGAGGHAQVVADILLSQPGRSIQLLGFIDDNPALIGQTHFKFPILGPVSSWSHWSADGLVLAIGHNRPRAAVFEQLKQEGANLVSAIHPQAIIASDVVLGEGCVVTAGAIINTGSHIGDNCLINTGATVDHHNHLASHVHIAPGVHLGGEVHIGTGALVGIGATVLPRCVVGEWSVVGGGSVVCHPIPAYTTVMGVPARPKPLKPENI